MKEPGIVGLHAGQYREACKYEGVDIEINENCKLHDSPNIMS